jgi:hypothetical protein
VKGNRPPNRTDHNHDDLGSQFHVTGPALPASETLPSLGQRRTERLLASVLAVVQREATQEP